MRWASARLLLVLVAFDDLPTNIHGDDNAPENQHLSGVFRSLLFILLPLTKSLVRPLFIPEKLCNLHPDVGVYGFNLFPYAVEPPQLPN
jgi:hypothetical protein